jgi:exopolysaccharide biosynthesis operon protein EpsL
MSADGPLNMWKHLVTCHGERRIANCTLLSNSGVPYKNRGLFMSAKNTLIYCLAGVALAPGAAMSDELDLLQFNAGLAWQHDSNVFRLSDQTPAPAGTSGRSDNILTTTAGLKLRKPYGLQRFEADIGLENTNYKRYSNLDFTSVNYAAAWRWSLTPAFHGNLTTDRREYVDNSADVQNTGQLNRKTDRSTRFDGEYEVDGVWRLLGGAFQRTNSNSQANTFEGDSKIIGAEAGVRYQFPYGASLAYRFRNGKGEYTNGALASSVSSDFTDREHEVQGEWVGGRAKLGGRISHLERNYDSISARDFSGFLSQIDLTYALTGKTSVFAGVVRELGSYQTNNISYYQGTRVFVAPTWKATENIALRARFDYGVRDFKGPLPGFVSNNRKDKTNLAVVSVEWQPVRLLTLMAWAQRDQRKSNEFGADYKSHSVGASAKVTF